MKITSLLTGLLAFLFVSPTLSYAATFALNPPNGTYNKGCKLDVQIILDSAGANVDSADAILLYNNAVLTLSQFPIQQGTLFPTYVPVTDNSSGKVTISGLSNPNQPYNSRGTFATISFQVRPDAPAGPFTVRFDFDPNNRQKTTDSNIVENGTVAELLSGVTDGAYTLGSGTPCNSTALTPATGSATISAQVGSPVLSPNGTSPGINFPTIAIASSAVVLVVLGLLGALIL